MSIVTNGSKKKVPMAYCGVNQSLCRLLGGGLARTFQLTGWPLEQALLSVRLPEDFRTHTMSESKQNVSLQARASPKSDKLVLC